MLRVVGEVDVATCHLLRDAIRARIDDGCDELIIDMSECTLCDAACFGTLAESASKRLAVTVRHPAPIVRRVFDALAASDVLTVEL